jgi:hypothetical protein
MNQRGLSKYVTIGIIVALIWLLLGGFFLWQKNKKNQPTTAWNADENLVNDLNANEQPNTGRLVPSGERTTTEDTESQTFLGYIKKMEEKMSAYYLTIDYVEWVTGDEAKKDALAAGECQELEKCAPEGFYIRNESKKVKVYPIAKTVDIRMQTYSRNKTTGGYNIDEKIDIKKFKEIFDPASVSPLKNVPYRVEIKDGYVISIIEKFIPRK